jgi:hypothetical protein
MTALQLVLCAWRRGNAAVECAFAVHLPVGAVDEVAEPENIDTNSTTKCEFFCMFSIFLRFLLLLLHGWLMHS